VTHRREKEPSLLQWLAFWTWFYLPKKDQLSPYGKEMTKAGELSREWKFFCRNFLVVFGQLFPSLI